MLVFINYYNDVFLLTNSTKV